MPKTAEMSFDINRPELELVSKIVDRYCAEFPTRDRTELTMDLIATHANGCPMDFAKLLRADDFNFFHDLHGIRRHINRRTGVLGDCFLPRCARNDA